MAEVKYANIHESLATEVPEFRSILEQHRYDHDGKVLQHVLFGDLSRFVLSARERGDAAAVARSLAFLERASESDDPRVSNLVAVSFVENVEPWDPAISAFIGDWPPSLQEVARTQGWAPIPKGPFVWMRHEFPWLERGFLHAVHESALQHLRTRLRDLGFELTELDGTATAAGRNEFFGDLQLAFGLPDYFGRNWDAFNDSIGDLEPSPRLAVIWLASDEAARSDPALFGEACAEFHRLAQAHSEKSIQIELFLIGTGDSYRFPHSVHRA